MTYSTEEQEVINLCICLEAVGDIANHELFYIIDDSSLQEQALVCFHSSTHQQMFFIRLLDFAREETDKGLTGMKDSSCLQVLKSVCQTKYFDCDNSISTLEESVLALEDWLLQKKTISLWLPTLEIEAVIEVSRMDFLRIFGNHSKHNLARLSRVSKAIYEILDNHGYSVSVKEIPLALDDFQEHLQENYFAYYGTWLAELVNNIRWGIQAYLWPAFLLAYKRVPNDPDGRYIYEYPPEIQDRLAKEWFWRLMNNILTRPYHKKFCGLSSLKKQSSLEKS